MRNVLIAVAAVVIGLLVVVGAWATFFVRSVQQDIKPVSSKEATVIRKALKKAEPQKPFTVLLLGADARPGEKAWRSDTMILAKVDPRKKRVWLLSIPRDTRAEIPGHGYDKINAAHFLGGPSLTIRTVEKLTGVPVNHYMEVNFRGFQEAVDAVGGVWINVDSNIDDWKAASHSYKHRAKRINKGFQRLDGEHALTYVRSRDFPDADFTRMRHQQQFFKALAAQMSRAENVPRLPSVIRAVARQTTADPDMTVWKMITIAQALRGMPAKDIQTATLKGEWRSPYVWPDEKLKRKLIAAMKAERSFDSTAPIPVEPADITVTVRNGAGVPGLGATAAGLLRTKSFKVTSVANAKRSDYASTLVVYRDNSAAASKVAAALPRGKVVAGNGEYLFDTDVLVVVGTDYPR